MVSSVAPLMAKADDSPLYQANKSAMFTSPACDKVTEEYAKQHVAKNPNAEGDKTGAVYPRVAVNLPGSKELDPQFRRKSGSDKPTSTEYAINSDGGNRGYMTVRVYIPETQVRHLESEACEESAIECPIPGDDDVVAVIKGRSVANEAQPGKFDVTYTYEKRGKDIKIKVFSDEKEPTKKYFFVSSRHADLLFPDSPAEVAEKADKYNEYCREALSKLPEGDPRKTYPGEVFFTACAEPPFSAFTGKVILTRNEDIVAATLKYRNPKGKSLIFVAASEVTVNGSPARQSAAEECIARTTGLYERANSGSIDHYYVDPTKRPQGCLYSPLKCAILRDSQIYCDEKAQLLPDITPENILSLPNTDLLLHASRNLNPDTGKACPPMLHPDPTANQRLTAILKEWHAKWTALSGLKRKKELKPEEIEKRKELESSLAALKATAEMTAMSALSKEEIYASAKQIICLARKEGYDTIVFHNPGGGIFRNSISAWADAIAQSIKAFGGDMCVVLAIFDTNFAPDCDALLPFEPASSAGKMNVDIYKAAMDRHGIAYELR